MKSSFFPSVMMFLMSVFHVNAALADDVVTSAEFANAWNSGASAITVHGVTVAGVDLPALILENYLNPFNRAAMTLSGGSVPGFTDGANALFLGSSSLAFAPGWDSPLNATIQNITIYGATNGAVSYTGNGTGAHNLSINDTFFYGNAGSTGGGVNVQTQMQSNAANEYVLADNFFISNSAANGGAVALATNNSFTSGANTFSVTSSLGGLGNTTDDLHLFGLNKATAGNGGGLYFMGNNALDVRNEFTAENYAYSQNSASGLGGAIYNGVLSGNGPSANIFSITGSNFTDNQAGSGGAVATTINGGSTNVEVTLDGLFGVNIASNNGGAIYNAVGDQYSPNGGTINFTITGPIVTNRAANGGGIYNDLRPGQSNVTVNIVKDSSEPTLPTMFISNTASGNGGAIYNTSGNNNPGTAVVNIEDGVLFIGNSANRGGAIYNDGNGVINLKTVEDGDGIKFTDNSASNSANGADIYQASASAVINITGTGLGYSGPGGSNTEAVEVNGGIAGVGTINQQWGTQLTLGDKSQNFDFKGVYNQGNASVLEAHGLMFGGTNNLGGRANIHSGLNTLYFNANVLDYARMDYYSTSTDRVSIGAASSDSAPGIQFKGTGANVNFYRDASLSQPWALYNLEQKINNGLNNTIIFHNSDVTFGSTDFTGGTEYQFEDNSVINLAGPLDPYQQYTFTNLTTNGVGDFDASNSLLSFRVGNDQGSLLADTINVLTGGGALGLGRVYVNDANGVLTGLRRVIYGDVLQFDATEEHSQYVATSRGTYKVTTMDKQYIQFDSISSTPPPTTSTTTAVDPSDGSTTSTTDHSGDGGGSTTTTTTADGGATTTVDDGSGATTATTTPDGGATTTVGDGSGATTTTITTPGGGATTIVDDGGGATATTITDPTNGGATTTTVDDGSGTTTITTDPTNGGATTTVDDGSGTTVITTDPTNGGATTTVDDGSGTTVTANQGGGSSLNHSDSDGNTTSSTTTNPDDGSTTTTTTHPGGGTTVVTTNPDGSTSLSHTDSDGNTTVVTTDAGGDSTITEPDGTTTDIPKGDSGNVSAGDGVTISVGDDGNGGTTTTLTDSGGSGSATVTTNPGGTGGSISSVTDPNNNTIDTSTDPGGTSTTTGTTSGGASTTTITTNPDGTTSSTVTTPGGSTTITTNPDGTTSSTVTTSGGASTTVTTNPDGTTIDATTPGGSTTKVDTTSGGTTIDTAHGGATTTVTTNPDGTTIDATTPGGSTTKVDTTSGGTTTTTVTTPDGTPGGTSTTTVTTDHNGGGSTVTNPDGSTAGTTPDADGGATGTVTKTPDPVAATILTLNDVNELTAAATTAGMSGAAARSWQVGENEVYKNADGLDPMAAGTFSVHGETAGTRDAVLSGLSTGGAAISLFDIQNDGASFNLQDLTVEDAYSADGGSVLNMDSASTATLNNLLVQNNESGADGGAVNVAQGTVTSTNVDYQGNTAAGSGGAIANSGTGNTSVLGGSFTDNAAAGDGGAIYNNSVNGMTIASGTGLKFTDNTATGDGGAIYNGAEVTLTLIADSLNTGDTTDGNIVFSGNTANGDTPNDIHNDGGDLVFTGSGGTIELGGGVSGTGTIAKQGESGLILGAEADNSGFTGTFTQTKGVVDANGAFFGGENSITGGVLNWNPGADKLDLAILTVTGGGTINVNKDATLRLANPDDIIAQEAATNLYGKIDLAGGTVYLSTQDHLVSPGGDLGTVDQSDGYLIIGGAGLAAPPGVIRQAGGVTRVDKEATVYLDGTAPNSGLLAGDIVISNATVSTRGYTFNYGPGGGTVVTTTGTLAMGDDALLDTADGALQTHTFSGKFGLFSDLGTTARANFIVDLDARVSRSDMFVFNDGTATSGLLVNGHPKQNGNPADIPDVTALPGTVVLAGLNLINSPTTRTVPFTIMSATGGINPGLTFTADDSLINTPIGAYGLYSLGAGRYELRLTGLNAQASRGQVATLATASGQAYVNNLLFDHVYLDSFDRAEGEGPGRPRQFVNTGKNFWAKPYFVSETLPLDGNIGDVDYDAYGLVMGLDFPASPLGNGWSFLPTVFAAFNRGTQDYQGVDMTQTGGQAGFMGAFSNGRFIASVMGYAGAYQSEMDVAGFSDNTNNWFAGAAAKAAYTFEAGENLAFQPYALLSYNVFGDQKWTSDYGDLPMETGSLNGWSAAPGLAVIYDRIGWSLTASAHYMFNFNNDVRGQAGDIDLPTLDTGGGYLEYGFGAAKKINDSLSLEAKATFRSNDDLKSYGGHLGLSWHF